MNERAFPVSDMTSRAAIVPVAIVAVTTPVVRAAKVFISPTVMVASEIVTASAPRPVIVAAP